MSRRLSGEASSEEMEELQALISQSPDKQYLLDLLHSYFQAASLPLSQEDAIESSRLEQKFNRIILSAGEPQAFPEPSRPSQKRIFSWMAAAAAILLLSFWLVQRSAAPAKSTTAGEEKGGEVVSHPGVRTRLVLPDGTQVALNSNSRLKYGAAFNHGNREIELEGEAYFEVAKDAEHPFIVHTAAITVKVLGTAFTVRDYPLDRTVEATLLKGSIEVSRPNNPNTPRVILKPNEKLVVDLLPVQPAHNNTAHIPVSSGAPNISVNLVPRNLPDSEREETSWIYNRLTFSGDSFKELAQKMERWYNVRINFKNESLYKYRFGGAFATETIAEALDALKLTASFTYTMNGNEIDLYAK